MKLNMEGNHLTPQTANVCFKCSVLLFNDSHIGRRLQLPGGRSVLAIHEGKDPAQLRPSSMTTPLEYFHHDKLPGLLGLLESAEAGCEFCSSLREAIQKTTLRGKRDGQIKIKLSYLWHRSTTAELGLRALVADLSIETSKEEQELFYADRVGFLAQWNLSAVDVQVDDNGTVWQLADFIVFTIESGSGNCNEWLRLEPAARSHPLSPANLEGLKAQLRTCATQCVHDSTSTSIPTRLLDLNAHDTTDGIRLIETKEHNLELPVHYAALSYCWGPPEDAATQFTTKGNTLNQRKREIPFSAMSRVMQDAVTVTRSLGFRYIWIDAVCIIQDNREDWEKEAEHMGAIYFNAFVTVVALASSSCHQGFLERTTGLPIPFTSSIDYSIQGTLQLKHVTFRGMNLLKSLGWRTSDIDLSFSAWPTRAWTVQEMELSPRLIYFGPSRVWFSCVEREVVEPFTLTHNSNDKRSQPRLATDLLLFTSEDMELLYDEWLALLDNFCFRKITKRSDRFPAISGMAKRIAEALDDVYLAGLWKGDFARGLLFIWVSEAQKLEQHVDLVAPPPVSGDEYLAPTWSPLVVTGHVEYRKCADFFSECEIVDAIITHVSQFNVFGQISRAEVRVRGHALLLPCDLEKEAHATRQFRNQWWIGSIREGCRIMCRLDWQSKVVVEILRGKLVLLFVGSYLADEEDWDGEGYSGGNRDAVGIILFPENEAEKRYYRVGWFECLVGDGGKDMLERWEYSTLTLV